uniref:Amidophosphoribosyltransferase n=1 Tax=Ignisphaera aggregans TaxID=334771 RepID=A0A7C2VL44_9CREN
MCGIAAFATTKKNTSCLGTIISLLIELQHRGQEASGIATVAKDGTAHTYVSKGTIFDLLGMSSLLETMTVDAFGVIGHTRYSTSGGYGDSEAQPIVVGNDSSFRIAVAFNGTIANYKQIAKELGIKNCRSDVTVLSEAIRKLALESGKDVVEALKTLSSIVIGGYSAVVLTSEPRLVIARDPRGFRPLSYAYNGEEFVAASETSALEVLGYDDWVEVPAGGIISYDGKSVEVVTAPGECPTPCAFEYVYIARLDSVFNGVSVYGVRLGLGYELSKRDSAEVDVVVPVPDSGRAAALGYSRGRGVPLEEGLVVNRYLGRGFIMPPGMREIIAKLKYGFVRSAVSEKRVALVDDSIVRGTTMAAIASRLKHIGAREVHVRISSPPFRYPCFMGVDVASRKELLAWRTMNLGDVACMLNADSVAFNNVETLAKVIGLPSACLACFTGRYPFKGLTVDDLENMFSR